ncbi:MAG: c-type cytochrome [Thermodesulfobacteriota bacterium]
MKKMVWVVATLLVVAFSGTAIAADGALIYASKCKMCHGAGGKGTAMMGPQLAGSDFIKGDAETMSSVIVNSRSGGESKYPNFPMSMPGFTMSDEELDALVGYLKSL